jgi:hypothetical protein
MPSIFRVCFTGRCDASTVRIISSFSETGLSFFVAPIPDHAFLEQTVLERQFNNHLFQGTGFRSQFFDFRRCRLSRRVTGSADLPQDPLACALLRPYHLAGQRVFQPVSADRDSGIPVAEIAGSAIRFCVRILEQACRPVPTIIGFARLSLPFTITTFNFILVLG